MVHFTCQLVRWQAKAMSGGRDYDKYPLHSLTGHRLTLFVPSEVREREVTRT